MADNQFDKHDAPERVNQTRSTKKQDASPKEPDEDGSGKPAKPPTDI